MARCPLAKRKKPLFPRNDVVDHLPINLGIVFIYLPHPERVTPHMHKLGAELAGDSLILEHVRLASLKFGLAPL
jgi:hypothetical protein